jgi:hypothetical protein
MRIAALFLVELLSEAMPVIFALALAWAITAIFG